MEVYSKDRLDILREINRRQWLKGKRVGGAQVSELHCGFIVNIDNATTDDILRLIRLIQRTVKHKFGVQLEPEVKIIGNIR